ncbi:MAG TPA: response regulator [Longimicrobiales bacterium]
MIQGFQATPRLLIVEDDAAMRQLLAARFREGGFEVTEASNARDALATRPGGGSFDLVLTDVHLPGRSGIDLARSLHEQAPSVPVVFVSGDANAQVIREALNTQSSAAYMIKPFAMSELDAVVKLILKHARAFTTPDLEAMEAHLSEVAPVAPVRFKNRIAHLMDPTPSPTPAAPRVADVPESSVQPAVRRMTIRQIVLLALLAALVVIATLVLRSQGNALTPAELTSHTESVVTAGTPRT